MPKYIEKPMIVDAVKWTGKNCEEILDFIQAKEIKHGLTNDNLIIKIFHGEIRADLGDYIIKDRLGKIFILSEHDFNASYGALD